MNNKDLISIVVPVYNLQDYIEDCLISLLNQTYKRIEIICVDDGSTDKSGMVIEKMIKSNDCIRYVKKNNGGVSSARNVGLNASKGKYVMFVDGDDFLHKQAVEFLYESILDSGSQMSCCFFCDTYTRSNDFALIEDRVNEIGDMHNVFKHRLELSVCGKLYDKQILSELHFDEELSNLEDYVFLMQVLSKNPKTSIVCHELYYYFQRVDSSSHSEIKQHQFNIFKSLSTIANVFYSEGNDFLLSSVLKKIFQYFFSLRTMCYEDLHGVLKYNKQEYVKPWVKVFLHNKSIEPKTKTLFTAFFFSRHLYELARLIQDPTMLDFYKNRRKHNGKSQKD